MEEYTEIKGTTLIFFYLGIYSQLTGNADKGIYTAYARGEGCTGGSCGGENCKITLNGAIELDTTVGPGFYLISYKYPSFTKLETKPFKTFFAGEAANMITWLNGLEDGTVILGCSIDDAATSMGAEGWAALVRLQCIVHRLIVLIAIHTFFYKYIVYKDIKAQIRQN